MARAPPIVALSKSYYCKAEATPDHEKQLTPKELTLILTLVLARIGSPVEMELRWQPVPPQTMIRNLTLGLFVAAVLALAQPAHAQSFLCEETFKLDDASMQQYRLGPSLPPPAPTPQPAPPP